jgi:cytochrome c-type biogenesis protein CcmE
MENQSRVRWIVGLAIVWVLGVLIYVSWEDLGENLVYYWTPSETLAKAARLKNKDATIRLGGVVAKGSVKWVAETLDLTFRVADSTETDAKNVLVDSKGAPPQMFREGIGVVVEGRLGADNVFHSDRVMVNHDNQYRPPTATQAKSGYGTESMQK